MKLGEGGGNGYIELNRRGATLISSQKRNPRTELVQFQLLGPLCNVYRKFINHTKNREQIRITFKPYKFKYIYIFRKHNCLVYVLSGHIFIWKILSENFSVIFTKFGTFLYFFRRWVPLCQKIIYCCVVGPYFQKLFFFPRPIRLRISRATIHFFFSDIFV